MRHQWLEPTKNLVILLQNGRVFVRQYDADDSLEPTGVSHLTAQDFDELQEELRERKIRWDSIDRWYVVRGKRYEKENDRVHRSPGNA